MATRPCKNVFQNELGARCSWSGNTGRVWLIFDWSTKHPSLANTNIKIRYQINHPVSEQGGCQRAQPILKPVLSHGANFTKEDFKDHCGHGTSMALMAVAGSPFPPKLISVKVAEADGRGSPDALIRALEWIAH